jgi:hypothetical protein
MRIPAKDELHQFDQIRLQAFPSLFLCNLLAIFLPIRLFFLPKYTLAPILIKFGENFFTLTAAFAEKWHSQLLADGIKLNWLWILNGSHLIKTVVYNYSCAGSCAGN